MAKVNTNQEAINEILERGVVKVFPDKKNLLDKLKSGRRLRLYCGFDPSAPSLHIGHAIQLNKLAQFQALGHEVIFLIGGFTGMIGDPTDKQATRQKLSRQQVKDNAKSFKKQAGAYIDFSGSNPVKVEDNSRWQDKLSFIDLVELSSNFTVQQMIQRDMFQDRLKNNKPIFLHEFLYPLAQAYDSVALDVDLEVGGNDQLFNMMAGRDLMKALGKKDKSVMTLQLLTDASGAKMGKTTGNALFLDAEAKNIYGAVMSWPDETIAPAFELATKVAWSEVKAIAKTLKQGKVNPRDLKMRLAYELTVLVHGKVAAQVAEDGFRQAFQQRQAPSDLPKIKADNLLEALAQYFGAKRSKGELRRLIDQGGVSINEVKNHDQMASLKAGDIIKAGKKDWFKIG